MHSQLELGEGFRALLLWGCYADQRSVQIVYGNTILTLGTVWQESAGLKLQSG